MPATHLLDTSVYSQPLKPKPLPTVENRWQALGDGAIVTSIICEGELLYGLELKQSRRLQAMYEQLLQGRVPVLPVDAEVIRTFAAIKAACRRKGFSASDFDFLIAATAKANGLTLATLNIRHFRGIEGLSVEDWSQ